MKFSVSLKDNRAFRRVYGKGKSAAAATLVVYARPRKGGGNRVGITVSAKLGGAVVRNRVKRRLREAYRLNEDRFSPGYDLIIVARSRAIGAPWGQLNADLLRTAKKLGVLA